MHLIPLAALPAVNASLNATCTVLLLAGFAFIRSGKIRHHRFCMIAAFVCSAVFLCFYLYFHFNAGVIRFGGHGAARAIYLTILITHTTLAVVIVPLILMTLSRALGGRFAAHRAIAKWTLPLWLYVSVTGVIVYWMLYIAYQPIWPAGFQS
jgi:putative membrane protein